MDNYFKDNQLGEDIFNRKYKSKDSETFKDRIQTVCNEISKIDNDKECNEVWFKQIYEDNIWMPGGSIIASVGVYRKQSTYNCTTIGINGDNLEDISRARYKLLKYAAYRQGIGVDFSVLRPNGSKLNNSARTSSGAINWMEDFDEAANHVGQNGRKPALLFSLKDTHPDFPEFIDLKTSYDKITNANISAQISNDFMFSVMDNKDWEMKFNTEHETIIRKENARKLFIKLCKNNLEYAEPGIQFIDTIHRLSNSDYIGKPVVSSNACSEKFLDPDGACNLCSINLEKVPIDIEEIDKFFAKHIPHIVRFMDNVITYESIHPNHSPHYDQFKSQAGLRRVGIGVTNLHAWLLKVNYDLKLLNNLFSLLMYHAYKASIELGKEKGSFPLFDRDKFEQSPYVEMLKRAGLEFTHMRNVELLAIAPTGTISMMFKEPVISYGVEPAFGLYYWKRTRISGKYEYYFIVPSVVRNILKENGIELPMDKLIIKDDFAGNKGSKITKIINANMGLFSNFKPATKWTVTDKLDMLRVISKYIDSAISTTFMLPEDATVDDVYNLYMRAWRAQIKSVTAYRDSSRYGIVELIPFKYRAIELHKQGKVLSKYDFTDEEIKELGFVPYVENQGKNTQIHKFTAEGGDKFYVIVSGDKKQIFIINYKIENRANERILAIANKLGQLVKSVDKVSYMKQLERSENSLNRFTRMLSTCMKLGLLDRALDILDEYSIAGNLAWYITRKVFEVNKNIHMECPVCGSEMVRTDDGCWQCNSCGYSRCE